MRLASLSSAVLSVALAACGPAAIDGGFDSANPAARMYAIEMAGRTEDRSTIPDLVEQLDSEDPGVRLLAITSLERLTGRTLGYRHYDPPEARSEAVQRWVRAVESGEIGADSAGSSAPGRTAPPPAQEGRSG